MGKGIDKFMKILNLSDDDDYENDDLFDDEEVDMVEPAPKKEPRHKKEQPAPQQAPAPAPGRPGKAPSGRVEASAFNTEPAGGSPSYQNRPAGRTFRPTGATQSAAPNKVVSMNRGGSTVEVIKPKGFEDAQIITDFMKEGRAVVINLEGSDAMEGQSIINFVGGACYALNGSLQAISNNMFIAAPPNVDVSGDLRENDLTGGISAPNIY